MNLFRSAIDFTGKECLLLDTACRQRYGLRRGLRHLYLLFGLRSPHLRIHNWFWSTYAKASRRRLVFLIGDSHARIFALQPGMIAHPISGATAHNLISDTSLTGARRKLFSALADIDRKVSVVVFIFGEVDCRVHLANKQPVEKHVADTIGNYGAVLKKIKEMGFSFAVCGVVPPREESLGERVSIAKIFNAALRQLCSDNTYTFLDLYQPFADESGFVRSEYLLDEIHLNSKIVPCVRTQLKASFGNLAL